MLGGENASLLAGEVLVADIDLGRRVFTDQHDGKPRNTFTGITTRIDLTAYLLAYAFGNGLAIYQLC